jgi:hypothetical protein
MQLELVEDTVYSIYSSTSTIIGDSTMNKPNLFTINTTTVGSVINGVRQHGILISTVHPITVKEAIAIMDVREQGREKVCFVNITPEQAEVVKPAVEALGRALYAPKKAGQSYLLGLPKRVPVESSVLISAFGLE